MSDLQKPIHQCLSRLEIKQEQVYLADQPKELIIQNYFLVEEIIITDRIGLNMEKVVFQNIPKLTTLIIGQFSFTHSSLVSENTMINKADSALFRNKRVSLILKDLPFLGKLSIGRGSFQDTTEFILEGSFFLSSQIDCSSLRTITIGSSVTRNESEDAIACCFYFCKYPRFESRRFTD